MKEEWSVPAISYIFVIGVSKTNRCSGSLSECCQHPICGSEIQERKIPFQAEPDKRRYDMRTLKALFTIGVISVMVTGCTTLPVRPDSETLDQYKTDIDSLAVLPLVLGSKDDLLAVGPGRNEVAGFLEHWIEHFEPAFRSQIQTIHPIDTKFAGTDFIISVDRDEDLWDIMEELGVDAVLCFNLTAYNEAKAGSQFLRGGLTGTREICSAEFEVHFCYLHIEDWKWSIYTTMMSGLGYGVESQRNQAMAAVLGWLKYNWPLSSDYVPREAE
jgi:hypothetical protein